LSARPSSNARALAQSSRSKQSAFATGGVPMGWSSSGRWWLVSGQGRSWDCGRGKSQAMACNGMRAWSRVCRAKHKLCFVILCFGR
jgi:hypothetical protein